MNNKHLVKLAAVLGAAAMLLTACGSKGYSTYATAYNRVSAKGGMDANLSATMTMDGTKQECSGNFKVDTSGSKAMLYYEMNVGSDKIIQFSDGDYLYTDDGVHKSKYALNAQPSQAEEKESGKQENGSQFNTSAFLQEFSSFLEAGKIRELGLMSPIDESVVRKTTVEGDVYTLDVSESLVKRVLNTMVANETGKSASETIQIEDLNNFKYQATVSGDYVKTVKYSGTVVVKVPGSLMSSGNEATYDLDFNITVDFQNPGSAVSVTLPSTDGYEETR